MSSVIGFSLAKGHPEPIKSYTDRLTYVWLEGMLDAKLAFLKDVPDWYDLNKWPEGRLFGEKGEYRWQRNIDNTLHGVIILDEGDLPEGFTGNIEIEKDAEEKDSSMILWGTWVDPAKEPKGNPTVGPLFYAKEIPQIQTYPITPEEAKKEGKIPCLSIRRYRHKPTEDEVVYKGEFVRCVSVYMKAEDKQEKKS